MSISVKQFQNNISKFVNFVVYTLYSVHTTFRCCDKAAAAVQCMLSLQSSNIIAVMLIVLSIHKKTVEHKPY